MVLSFGQGAADSYRAAGGGYYGGASCGGGYIGGGGSSYISGHTGSVAIASADDVVQPRSPRLDSQGVACTDNSSDALCSQHYSGKVFFDTVMIDGQGRRWTNQVGPLQRMPSPAGGYYQLGQGHNDNRSKMPDYDKATGFARVSFLGDSATGGAYWGSFTPTKDFILGWTNGHF